MIEYGIDAKIIKIASPIFAKSCLNMSLKDIYEYMLSVSTPYEFNFCGEGGEFEFIALNCKHFKNRITIEDYKVLQKRRTKMDMFFMQNIQKLTCARNKKYL